jgi:hypothetical protein
MEFPMSVTNRRDHQDHHRPLPGQHNLEADVKMLVEGRDPKAMEVAARLAHRDRALGA